MRRFLLRSLLSLFLVPLLAGGSNRLQADSLYVGNNLDVFDGEGNLTTTESSVQRFDATTGTVCGRVGAGGKWRRVWN